VGAIEKEGMMERIKKIIAVLIIFFSHFRFGGTVRW
jgi:hypothetical protein